MATADSPSKGLFKSALTDDELLRLKKIANLATDDFRTVRQSLFNYGGDVANAQRQMFP